MHSQQSIKKFWSGTLTQPLFYVPQLTF